MKGTDIIRDLQKLYPILNEGYGTEYERLSMNKLVSRFVTTYPIKTVLEMPANGIMGIPGINSLIFAKMGCDVTVSHPSQELLDDARAVWDCFGLEAKFVQSPWIGSRFDDGSFDLVYNFCSLGHGDTYPQILEEMFRVSRSYIFLGIPNIHNIFRFLQDESLYNGVDLPDLENIFQKFHARTLEKGAMDMPPWPDVNLRLKERMSGSRNEAGRRNCAGSELRPEVKTKDLARIAQEIRSFRKPSFREEMVYAIFNTWHSIIERHTPFWMKGYFAHHPYILAGKHDGQDR